MKAHLLLPILVAVAVLLACGCLSLPSPAEDLGFGGYSTSEEDASYQKGAVAPVYAPEASTASFTPSNAPIGDTDRKMIMTGTVELEVQDVETAAIALGSIADTHKGYVSSSGLRKNPDGRGYGSVVLRVPSAEFNGAMGDIRALGMVISQNTNANDVTEEYIDLEARLGALEAQLAQYRHIMEKAEEVEDILRVQVEIERVQVEIERITGRMQYLDDRIDFATITVSLTEPTPVGGDLGHDFADVFNQAIGAFLTTVDLLIIAFFALLPLALLGGGVWAIMNRRRLKNRKE